MKTTTNKLTTPGARSVEVRTIEVRVPVYDGPPLNVVWLHESPDCSPYSGKRKGGAR